ncbi:unnamed protein product [Effrenium voratum]|nr:unnamed protein product [Effrenium voratum]
MASVTLEVLEEKHKEVMARFDALLAHQLMLQKLVMDGVAVPHTETLNPETEALDLDMAPSRRNSHSSDESPLDETASYELAKLRSSLHHQKRLNEANEAESEPAQQPETERCLKRECLTTWQFESFFAAVLVSNAIFLGVQTEWTSANLHAEQPTAFAVLQTVYAALFIAEIVLRIAARGIRAYICSSDWAWHFLDIFVSVSAVLDVVTMFLGNDAAPTGSSSSGFRLLRIMKIARLARAIRVVKVLRFIRALRVLVYSILHTLRSLVWSLVLLLVIIYSFGILFADATIDHLLEDTEIPAHVSEGLAEHFGSLFASMNTLFRSISGGVTWEVPAKSLQHIGMEWVLGFTFYVAFCLFAVLNVMTGVFCHSAITGAEKDQDLLVQALLAEKETFKKRLLDLFNQVDDGTGQVTLVEFENRFEEESVRALFEALELGASDAWTLFQILDADGSNYIHVDEFVDSCIRNRGNAKSVDVCALRHQMTKLRGQMVDMLKCQEQLQASVVTSQKEKLHLQCRMEEAEAKRTSDKCDKASAELQRSLQEDPTCRSWPALKAMTASSAAADCKDPQAEESYEEYLERMRSEFDSQLLLYRGIKNACAAREKAIMNCDQEKIAYIQKLQVCNKMQYHLEKASCQHATELRDAWNGYSGCWSDINRRYRAEAAQASQLQEAQVKEFQATKKIECMLGGFRSPQPKKVLQKCEEEAQNASLPSELQISLLCPPAYRQPERLPLYPGSKGYATKYAGVPSEAPVTKSIRCLVEKAVNVSEAKSISTPEMVPAPAPLASQYESTVERLKKGEFFKEVPLCFAAMDVRTLADGGLRVCNIIQVDPSVPRFMPSSLVNGIIKTLVCNGATYLKMAQTQLPEPLAVEGPSSAEALEQVRTGGQTVQMSRLLAEVLGVSTKANSVSHA